MTPTVKWILGIVIIVLVAWLWYLYKVPEKLRSSDQANGTARLRVCPDEWYENRMPTVTSDGPASVPQLLYLIVDGQRVEAKDYDLGWISANCPVNKPTIVQ